MMPVREGKRLEYFVSLSLDGLTLCIRHPFAAGGAYQLAFSADIAVVDCGERIVRGDKVRLQRFLWRAGVVDGDLMEVFPCW